LNNDKIIIALTKKGSVLAKKLSDHLKAEMRIPRRFVSEADQLAGFSCPVAEEIQSAFMVHSTLVLIMATGIAVRSIAPVLRNKQVDPAVLVIDEEGRFVISLLSGNWGGANQLAVDVAKYLKASAVITTPSDINELPSLDLLAKDYHLKIDRPELLLKFSGAIVNDEPLVVWDHWGIDLTWPENIRLVKDKPPQFTPEERMLLIIGYRELESMTPGLSILALRPSCLTVGIDCRQGVSGPRITGAIRRYFREHYWSIRCIRSVNIIDLKQDEPGINEACKELDIPLIPFTQSQLQKAMPNLKNLQFGLDEICEPAAILGTKNGKLIGPKQNFGQITVAVALDDSR
jgi:Cobalamin biosynthesis protein CbiG